MRCLYSGEETSLVVVNQDLDETFNSWRYQWLDLQSLVCGCTPPLGRMLYPVAATYALYLLGYQFGLSTSMMFGFSPQVQVEDRQS